MNLTKDEIKKIIPHRDPFLFLDEIRDLDSLVSAVGIKYVNPSDYYFQGHFPDKPVMPGVIIIEALAQVGAVILLSHPDYHGKIAYFTGISNAKFRRSVLPGDTLELKCTVNKIRRGFGYGTAKAYVNQELACEADISFAVGS
jgi:3-hydroxyacyl-[acyl-carrier-protein] dehydratase